MPTGLAIVHWIGCINAINTDLRFEKLGFIRYWIFLVKISLRVGSLRKLTIGVCGNMGSQSVLLLTIIQFCIIIFLMSGFFYLKFLTTTGVLEVDLHGLVSNKSLCYIFLTLLNVF